MGFAHGDKPAFSEKGIRPQPVIFISSAGVRPLLLFAQYGSQTTAYEAVEGVEGITMSMLEVSKPASDRRIQIEYDFLDAVTARSTRLHTDIILKPLETFRPHISTAILKPVP